MWNSSVAHLHAGDEAGEVVDVEILLFVAVEHSVIITCCIASGKPPVSCFWKKHLLADALRAAHEAERPLADMRQHQLGDRFVIADEVALGDALRRDRRTLVGAA